MTIFNIVVMVVSLIFTVATFQFIKNNDKTEAFIDKYEMWALVLIFNFVFPIIGLFLCAENFYLPQPIHYWWMYPISLFWCPALLIVVIPLGKVVKYVVVPLCRMFMKLCNGIATTADRDLHDQ